MDQLQPERFHSFTIEREEDAERAFWNDVLNAFADVCSKSELLNFDDEVENLRDTDQQEAMNALYDRLCMVGDETGEDPDDVIARYKLFEDP